MPRKSTHTVEVISIVLKPRNSSKLANIIPKLIDWAKINHKILQFLDKEKIRLGKMKIDIKKFKFISDENLFEKSDLIISLGGDGTLISTCRKSPKSKVPIFGVNLGHLGFITEFSKEECLEELSRFVNGKQNIVKIGLYKIEVLRKKKMIHKEFFFNDVVISKMGIARMFSLSVQSDDELIYKLSGDGLIISTPTGSTAYSLAAGGPIIHPHVKAMLLTPICPHSLTKRPLVLSERSKIKINIISKQDSISATLDGQVLLHVEKDDEIVISKTNSNSVKLVKHIESQYFSNLKEKFTYGRKI